MVLISHGWGESHKDAERKLNDRVFCQSASPGLTKVWFNNVWREKILPEGLGSVRKEQREVGAGSCKTGEDQCSCC